MKGRPEMLRMCPDYDLIQEIAGKGSSYEVLEPQSFREQIVEFLENAAALYRKKD